MDSSNKEKRALLRQLKVSQRGDDTPDDDLERSLNYLPAGERAKKKYKDFYDDVKLHVSEDW